LTRTNNPFAPSPSPSTNQTQPQQQRPAPTFNLKGTYETPSYETPSNQGNPGQRPFAVKKKEEENESLAALFADREGGQDTFGNIGSLRFIVLLFKIIWSNFLFSLYRYGYTDAGKSVMATKTGSSHNPFAQQQQQQNNDKPFFDI